MTEMHLSGLQPTWLSHLRPAQAEEPRQATPEPVDDFRVSCVELDSLRPRPHGVALLPSEEAPAAEPASEPTRFSAAPIRAYADMQLRMMLARHAIYLDEAGLRQLARPTKGPSS